MRQDTSDPVVIRRYLLGELTVEEDRQAVEDRMLLDDAFFAEFELAQDNLIDEYVNQELTTQERDNFNRYFLTTAERRAAVSEAQALTRYAKKNIPEPVPAERGKVMRTGRFGFTRTWLQSKNLKVAAGLLLVIGLSFFVWRVFFFKSDAERGLLALKNAYRLQRPVEARISALDYAQLPNPRGNDHSRVDAIARQRAERFLLDAEHSEPGARSYHALGVYYLTQLQFDAAIQQFKRALALNDNDAQLHSDLGAALLEKGKADQQSGAEAKSFEEFAESLQHLNRALQINDSLLEALFNRALDHHYMSLPQAEADDWRHYLEKDSSSPWADEARNRLKQLEQKTPTSLKPDDVPKAFLDACQRHDEETAWKLLASNRNLTGGIIENDLLDKYLTFDNAGNSIEAQRPLQALIYAAELNVRKAGDHYFSGLVSFYKSATPAQRRSLTKGRTLLNEGHKYLQQFDPENAIERYNRAAQIFEQWGDSQESMFTRYPLAHSYLLEHDSERSLRLFREVARHSEANQYRWLLAQSLGGIGNAETGLNEYSDALDNSNKSREIAEQIGDLRGQMKIADQLSNIYTRLGNYGQALESQTRVLSLINEPGVDPLQVWRSNFLIATPLQLLGLSAAAADFQKESLRVAIEAKRPYYICRSRIGLGLIYGSDGSYEEATKNVRLAFDLAKDIPSEAIRIDTLGYSSLQLGHLYRQAGDFNKAIESYDEVLKFSEKADYQAFVYAAHKGKLLSCIAQGGCPSINSEIDQTLRLFENYREKILEQENKFVFFDAEQNVYDAVIDYEYSAAGNSAAALDFAERSRARSLLELTTTQEEPSVKNHSDRGKQASSISQLPLESGEIRRRMPEASQILQYSVLPHRILIWLISTSGVQTFRTEVDDAELREKVSAYLQLISAPSIDSEAQLRSLSAEFYDLLIGPAAGALDANKQLCIVPDKALNYVPFAALFSRASGKYLTQEYVLNQAPSSTLFVLGYEKARDKETTVPERLLSVGNPRFDRQLFATLADLPDAKREADEIAAYYNTTAITGDKAVKERIVSEMEKADVIHLAMHAVVNEQSPLRSKLIFASDKSVQDDSLDNTTLQLSEIGKIPMPRTRLVVLSACQTGFGRYYGGEGMVGISRPFIGHGVPLVVASLWPVDSEATAELMTSFHRRRVKEHNPTALALSLAQREMLDSSDRRYRNPYYWASFVAIGGYTRF